MYVVGAIANPPKNPRSGEKNGKIIAITVVEPAIHKVSMMITAVNIGLDLSKII